MAIFDLNAACVEMARLLGAVTPPSGETMRKAYSAQPNNTPMLPCTIVVPQTGTYTLIPGGYDSEHTVEVWFLLQKSQGDLARIETRRQKWLPVLVHAFDGEYRLGMSTLRKVYVVNYSFEELVYGGQSYDGIRLTFSIDAQEFVSMAA